MQKREIDGGVLVLLLALLGTSFGLLESSPMASNDAQAGFIEARSTSGIDFRHDRGSFGQKHLLETMGSGCALLDYDQDGWQDLFLISGDIESDNTYQHSLYRNLGNGKFEDVTANAGIAAANAYGMGVAVGDYNNDGYPDIYVTSFGPNLLYRNNGDGTFTEIGHIAGVDCPEWGSSAAFLDFDNDGYLDLYVANYLSYPIDSRQVCSEGGIQSYCHPSAFPGVADKLFKNTGDGRFSDVSKQSGIALSEGKGLGVIAADLDSDGWIDLYVANDTVRNFLFRNNGDGSFADLTFPSGTGYSPEGEAEAGMGIAGGDYNSDGWFDLFVTNYDMETNALYANLGNGIFEDRRWINGVAQPSVRLLGFGTGFLDFDNDCNLDLLVVNGHVLDNIESIRDNIYYRQPLQLLENLGGGSFTEHAVFSEFARANPRVGRGAAIGDIDNDGRIDVVVSNSGEEPLLLMNRDANSNNWILIELIGTRSNRDGIGARIIARTKDTVQIAQLSGGGSYLSSSDKRIHFGLGSATILQALEVRWPSGIREVFKDLPVNEFFSIEEGSGEALLHD